MNNPDPASSETPAGRDEMLSALFAQMVMQQANMALMLLGKMANPATGEIMHDLEAARYFIDQLDMLEVKTKGNLTKDESALLRQSLMTLRLAFVEATDKTATQPQPGARPAAEPSPAAAENKTAAPVETDAASAKKFSKKY